MKVVYIDHNDSFADLIAYRLEESGSRLHNRGELAESIEVKMYKSNCDLDTICNEFPDLILLGPGPNSPSEAGNYLEALERFHEEYPIFGICLGFQSMMDYFGNSVVVLEDAIHGGASLIEHNGKLLFDGIENPVKFARYHSLGVYDVPSGFEILAHYPDSNGKDIVMAARHLELPIAGVQFHPESFMSTGNEAGIKLFENVLKYLPNKEKYFK